MPTAQIGDYGMEYTAQQLEVTKTWAAYLALFIPSDNPMHRNNIFVRQRVSAHLDFSDEAAAEAEAYRVGMEIIAAPPRRMPPAR